VRIRQRVKLDSPRNLLPGDVLQVTINTEDDFGNVWEKHTLVQDRIERPLTVVEAVTFDVEPGDGFGAKGGIGGALLE